MIPVSTGVSGSVVGIVGSFGNVETIPVSVGLVITGSDHRLGYNWLRCFARDR